MKHNITAAADNKAYLKKESQNFSKQIQKPSYPSDDLTVSVLRDTFGTEWKSPNYT